jgi:Secretion system C-terminal sorting domain
MGTWNVTGNQLVARNFNGSFWLTQRATAYPEQFAVRGSEMLQRGDVVLTNPTYGSLVGCFAYQYSQFQGLGTPNSNTFPLPIGFSPVSAYDQTPNYLQDTPTSPPNYNGFFDVADCGTLSGWAWNAVIPNGSLNIEILEGSNVVATGSANLYRADLQQAGLGNGVHAFQIPTPASLKNGQTRTLTARIAGSSYTLNSSPKTISGCYSMNARAAIDETRNSDEIINGLVVSPNPSDGLYNLNFSTTMGSSVALMVTNLSGSVVLEQDFKAASATVNHVINLRSKPNGEYLISIITEGKRLIQKVVKIE